MSTDVTISLPPTPILKGLRTVAMDYDGFVLDLWGVVHDGVTVFPGVVEALAKLRAEGKRLMFLSNAPRRAAVVADQLADFGIPHDLHDGVLTSGEITWRHLDTRPDAWYRSLGRACFRLGPGRDLGLLDGLDLDLVDSIATADFVLVTGPMTDREADAATYDKILGEAYARKLPMICANPDREVIRGGHRQICAGAIAERYERLGGGVRWHGKPDPSIYSDCLAKLRIADRARVLAVGDSFATDIRGANAARLDALLVAHGIHSAALAGPDGALDGRRIAEGAAAAGVIVIGALPALFW